MGRIVGKILAEKKAPKLEAEKPKEPTPIVSVKAKKSEELK